MSNQKNEKQVLTEASKIWDKISNLPIDIFALPNQCVKDYVKRQEKLEKGMSDTLFLELRSSAVRPALEETLATKVKLPNGNVFEVSDMSNYTTVKIVSK